ncbi:3493_t:CDS:2 [Funneliformis geosporum]|uniref:9090_t:CDS:1 n=1 Tax=Funneliformis geosporum TaxID=1117311 RepID=A0A9W4SQC3_9GLOM|nr:3493_t:CDS:2 [Funneliformis geosporum]CAI2176637.1 9090_t:CDS:2 [Funneliformis geosporum]
MSLHHLLKDFLIHDYFVLISIILAIYVAQYYYKYFTRVNPLPGPFPFPLTGNLPQFLLIHRGNFKTFFEHYQKKHGDIFEFHLGTRRIVLSKPEYVEKILMPSTKSQYMMRFPYVQGLEEIGMMGRGLLANHNLKSWRYNRQFFTQAILAPKFSKEAIVWTNKLFNELETYWNKLYLKEEIIKEEKNKMDFSAWLNRYTNDMIIALTTGERSYTMAAYFNTQSDEKAEHPQSIIDDSEKFVKAFRTHILGLPIFIFIPYILRHYAPHLNRVSNALLKNIEFIYQRLDVIIKRRRQEIENTSLDKPLPHDMLTSVITANTPRDINQIKTVEGESMGRPMNDTEIRGIMFDGFLGGTDTTANMISFIVYHLDHNPDVKKKMLKEIDEIFQGDRERPITEDDFHKLKYCEAIIKEVDRVLPVANMMVRYSQEPDEVAGYNWPAGTIFHINAVSIHKHNDYWEEPEKFNPDRWMVKGFEPKKYSFIMFGGGLRICPGRKLAMIELICLMALIYRKYEVDLVDKKSPLKTVSTALTTCPELLVKIRPRL